MDDLTSVVEKVVERSSWEKSRRGHKCCFPPKGGLHYTSGDASLEMHLEIPNWCYAYKSQLPLSRRTRAAAAEYRIVSQIHWGHSTNHRRCVSVNRKRFKQRNYLCKVKSRKVASLNIQCLLTDFIKNNIVVCNGGNDHKRVLSPALNTTWHCLQICNSDLWVADTVNPNIGLWYSQHDGSPIFVHLPRLDSFNIMRETTQLCLAIRSCAKNQHTTLSRGTQTHVFVEDNHKYCCVGSQPCRAERGVKSSLYRLKNGFKSKEWDVIHNVLRRSEYAFDRYMDTEVI
jgi:hypothetical protein